MPYLKFCSREERERAEEIWFDLTENSSGKIQGLIAVIKDSGHGIVDFYSEEPYLEAFDKAGIKYQLIPKENISSAYVDSLRRRFPQYSAEL